MTSTWPARLIHPTSLGGDSGPRYAASPCRGEWGLALACMCCPDPVILCTTSPCKGIPGPGGPCLIPLSASAKGSWLTCATMPASDHLPVKGSWPGGLRPVTPTSCRKGLLARWAVSHCPQASASSVTLYPPAAKTISRTDRMVVFCCHHQRVPRRD